MKVKAQDDAINCMKKRKAFRWNGRRGHKSKTAEGCYGVFMRLGGHTFPRQQITVLMMVYEPRTKLWYTTAVRSRELQVDSRIEFTDLNTKLLEDPEPLADIYKHGYVALVKARLGVQA